MKKIIKIIIALAAAALIIAAAAASVRQSEYPHANHVVRNAPPGQLLPYKER